MAIRKDTVQFTVKDGVATIVINRPEAMNAIDPETEAALIECWVRVASSDEIRVAVVTGSGEKAFSTGADLKKTADAGQSYATKALRDGGDRDFLSGIEGDKPYVCAINGYALGGGLELALACDIRIAAPHARLGLPEVKVGTIPGAGGTQRLPRLLGGSDAMMMLLTGEPIDAVEALRLGLISRVVPAEELLDHARGIARKIADNAPLSVRAIKRLVRSGAEMPLSEALEFERMLWGLLRGTEDRAEGRRAFAEKRRPNFVGR